MRATLTIDGQAVLVEFDYSVGHPDDGEGESYGVRSVKRDGAEIEYNDHQIVNALIEKKKQLIEEAKKEASIGY